MKGLYGCIFCILLGSSVYSQTITSQQDGPWSQGSTWVGGLVPTNLNSTSIIINSGHTVNFDVSGSVDQVTVSGTLEIDPGITMTLANGTGDEILVNSSGVLANNGIIAFGTIPNRTVIVNGSLNNNGTFTNVATAKLSFGSGSNYFHVFADGGTIPAAAWNTNSTVNIIGYTSGNSTPPAGLSQSFGNFVWNAPGQDVTISLNGQPTNINGDFRVESTGGDALFYSIGGAGNTMNIAGDFQVFGGVLGWTTGDAAPSFLNIGGNIDITSGYVQFADDVNLTINLTGAFSLSGDGAIDFSASSAVTNLNIQGNYSHTGGDMYVNGGTGNVNFIGASTKTFTSGIEPFGSVNYSVAALSTLDMLGESFIGGGGNFTLNGTLRLGSTNTSGALQTGGLAGNLRIGGTRTYVANATIVYNGLGPQFIGNGFPSGGDVNLSINNSSGVTLSTSLDIVALRTLNLASGNIIIGSQTLTINGTVTGTGGIIGGPSSNMVIGGTGNFGTLIFNGTSELQDFTLNRTGSGLVTLGEDLTILGDFTHTNGTLAIDDNTLVISGNYQPATPANLSVTNLSTVIIDGEGTLPTDVSFAGTELGTLTINRAGTTLPTSSSIAIQTLNLYSGIFDNGTGIAIAAGGTIRRRGGPSGGSMTTNPSNTTDAYNVVYEDGAITTGPELPSSTTALANLLKSGTGAVTLSSDITVNGTLSLSNGSFNAGANTIDLKGNFASAAASTLTAATVIFSGTTTISGSAQPTFGAVTITGTMTPNVSYRINGNLTNSGTLNAGTGSVTFGGTTAISGGSNSFNGVTIATGSSLTLPASGSINVAGNFVDNGTFTHNSGTVVFSGTSAISGTATPTFHHVTVSGTLTGPANLNLNGNLNVNGTFVHNSGTVTFNGTGTQSLNRTSGAAGNVDLFNVTINKPSSTFLVESTVAGTIFRVENQFNIAANGTAGTDVDFDGPTGAGTLLLRSTSTRTARIPAVATGATTAGNLTVERFIPNNDGIRAYRYLAPPVVGSNVADWKNEIQITGQMSDPSTGGVPSSSPSMYRYLETNGGAYSNRYQAYPNNAAQPASAFGLANGTGYAVYGYNAGAPTLNTRGTLRTGNAPVTLTITGSEVDAAGFNLIGNPYPAPIDWDLVTLPGGVSSTISIKDNVDNAGAGTGNFVYYVQGGPNVGGFTGVIASGQAFWVETGSNTTLTFTEANKASDINPIFVREGTLADVLRINIEGNGKSDESVIWLNEEATEGADLRFDAKKKINDFLNLYTLFDGSPKLKYAINGLKEFGCSKSFKLGISDINSDSVNIVTPGTYILNFSQFESFTKDYRFSLIDKFKNEVLADIREQPEYTFEITADPRTFGEERFELVVTQPEFETDNVIHYEPVCENTAARITIENTDALVSYRVRDVNGQTISDIVQGNGNSIVLNILQEKLVNGSNNLLVYANNGFCEAVPLQQTVTLDVNEIYTVSSVENGRSCNTGTLTLKALGVPADGEYYWFESESSVEPIATGSTFTTPELNKSKTYYVAARNALGCEGPRVEVKADVVLFEEAAITAGDGGLLTANYNENVQWYFNDAPIADATEKEIVADQSGIYKVEAKISGCVTSAQYEFSVTGIEEGFNKTIQVYPNPTVDHVSIRLKNPEPASAVVVNTVGKPIGTIRFVLVDGVQTAEFNLAGEAAGMYLIKILQANKSVNYKLIKK